MSPPACGSTRPEDRFRAIVEAQPELICLSRPDGELAYVNPAFARHFGLAPAQMLGADLFEHVLAQDRVAVRQMPADVLASGQVSVSEHRMVDAQGRASWVVWTNRVQREGDDALLCSVGHDVTRRRTLELELVESDAFVRKITDSLPLRIAYVDRERRFRFVNQAHCRRFGRRREEILGRTREELLGRAASPEIEASTEGALAGVTQRLEYDDLVDGATRRFDIQLIPDIEIDGSVRGFFYTGLDITDRASAEHALRTLTLEAQAQSDILRLVTEAIPATVVVVGADGRYRFANGAFERYCGLPRDQIIGHTAVQVLGAAEVARLGGDEFVILLSDAGALAHSDAVADKVVAAIGAPFDVDGQALHIGASVGVAFGVAAQADRGELIRRADAALYRAKASGRGRYAN